MTPPQMLGQERIAGGGRRLVWTLEEGELSHDAGPGMSAVIAHIRSLGPSVESVTGSKTVRSF
jgi:hypothetical protein